jgi:putative colanic acid biosynthesis UDP-glucose lipid carrier transferase
MFAFAGYNYDLHIYPLIIFKHVLISFFGIAFFKFALYYLLQRYRTSFGGNYRKTVIFGVNKKTVALESFFKNNPEYGYIHKRTFSFKEKSNMELAECFEYIISEDIDEIYCSISELSNYQINEIADFVDNNLKILKFLPDNKEIYSKKLKYDI